MRWGVHVDMCIVRVRKCPVLTHHVLSPPPVSNIASIVCDIMGKLQLCCRYITPQRPPHSYERPELFTRFVSQIPFLNDIQMSDGGMSDIWCTSKELMALSAGDWEEHAILLANYFAVSGQHIICLLCTCACSAQSSHPYMSFTHDVFVYCRLLVR